MSSDAPMIGGRIRQLRRQRGLSQADLAAQLGISGSYLNLIEHNRRKVTVPLLLTLTRTFGLDLADLTRGDEAQLAGDLMEVFGAEIFAHLDLTNREVEELGRSSPNIARAIIHLHDRYRHAREGQPLPESAPRLVSEQVSDFLQANANHFPALEAVAARINADLHDRPAFDALASYLSNVFGTVARIQPVAALQHDGAALLIPESLPPESRSFALARAIAEDAAEAELTTLCDPDSFADPAAARLARSALVGYVAGAILMPYTPFLRDAEAMRYDVERLALRYGASFEQVCHRLTTLQRPGEAGIPFHLVRTDIAGNISKRFSISGIRIPRHGGACPRWNLYEAFLQPGRITVQISQMPEGQRFFCIARSLTKGENRYGASQRHMAIGLGCDLTHAGRMIYSDGMDLTAPDRVVPVGTSCRSCPRQDCTTRAFPAMAGAE